MSRRETHDEALLGHMRRYAGIAYHSSPAPGHTPSATCPVCLPGACRPRHRGPRTPARMRHHPAPAGGGLRPQPRRLLACAVAALALLPLSESG